MEGAVRRRCEHKSKCGVGCVREGEEKAGGGWRSSEEQEEQMKWEVKKSGGGWQRVRISFQSQLARQWGNAAPGASFPAWAASVQPSAAGMR